MILKIRSKWFKNTAIKATQLRSTEASGSLRTLKNMKLGLKKIQNQKAKEKYQPRRHHESGSWRGP
jgi:hypothetical protein